MEEGPCPHFTGSLRAQSCFLALLAQVSTGLPLCESTGACILNSETSWTPPQVPQLGQDPRALALRDVIRVFPLHVWSHYRGASARGLGSGVW
jgi:hypothetical protein